MRSIFFLLAIFAGIASSAQNENENYDALNGPFGGSVLDMETNSSGHLLAAVRGAGVYTSTDGAATWTLTTTGITDYTVNDFEKDPTGKIYLLCAYRLMSSVDGGQNWVAVSTNVSNGQKLKRAPNGYLYYISYNKIYRSTNSGTTWSEVFPLPSGSDATDMAINSSGHIFVSTRGGVYRSRNNGVNWETLGIAQGLANVIVHSIVVSGSDIYCLTEQDGPFKSTNGGDLFTSVKSNITDFYSYGLIRTDGAGGVYFFNSSYSRLWQTIDGGATWNLLGSPLSSGIYGTVRTIFFENSVNYYIGLDADYLYKTIDGGASWFGASSNIAATEPQQLYFINTSPPRMLHASGRSGFQYSIDEGATWDVQNFGELDRQISGFVAEGTNVLAYGRGIVKTANNGSSWTEVEDGSELYFDKIVGVGTTHYSFSTYDPVTFVNAYMIRRSGDGGANWTYSSVSGMPSSATSYPSGPRFHVNNAGTAAFMVIYNYSGPGANEIYRIDLTNATLPATKITFPTANLSYFGFYNDNVFAVGFSPSAMYVSPDGGQTWGSSMSVPSPAQIKVISDNTIYLMSTHLYITTDGGSNWVDTGTFSSDGLNGYVYVADVVISPTNYAYVAPRYGPVFKSVAQVIPPAPPSGLTIYGHSAFNVGLKWNDNSTNEQYFLVERSEGNNLNYDSVVTQGASGLNFAIRGVSAPLDNTLYYYRVRAVGAAGKSAYSNEVSVTSLDNCQVYTVPNNRSWTATTNNESGAGIFVANPVSITGGFGNYLVSNLNAGATTGITPAINPATQVSIQEVCGVLYMSSNSPMYANGNGTWDSSTNTLTIHWQTRPNYTPYRAETTVFTLNATDPAPSEPASLSAYVKTPNEVVVTWFASTYGQQYQVQRTTTSGSAYVDVGTPILTGSPLLLVDNFSFVSGTTYYYRVVATSVGGASTPSAEVSLPFQTPLFEAISLVGFDFSTQGVAWIDMDNDDDDDLIVTPFNGVDPNDALTIFENLGGALLQKATVTGVSDYHIGTFRTVSVGDANNDGMTDFLSVGSVSGGDLFINRGYKEFERTQLVPPDETGLQWYASLVDFNNDGRLDAVVQQDDVNDDTGQPLTTYMKLFTQGSDGVFGPYELGEIAADATLSRGGGWADIDNDGDQDFIKTRNGIAAGDFDQLYVNNGDGTFSAATGTAFESDYFLSPRTVSWADFDNDLDMDVFIGHNASNPGTVPGSPAPNMLYRNNGDGTFTGLTSSIPAEAKAVGVVTFGSAWGDIDNDGDQDLVVANSLQCALYLNDGAGGFVKYTAAEYLVASDATRTNITFAMSDYDKNGSLDIATGKNIANFPTILLKNNLAIGANSKWLEIKLVGTTSNRSGIGARIVVTTPDTKKQMRAVSAHSGYGSTSSLIAHFGLKNQASATSIEVFWPSGVHTVISTTTAANQRITITEDGNGPAAATLLPANLASNVTTSTKLEITLNEDITAVAGKKIKLATADPGTPVFEADITAGTKVNRTFSFTLPSRLAASTAYEVTIDAGAFVDGHGQLSLAMPGSAWTFTTGPNPQPTLLVPRHNAINVPITTKIEITFDRNITAVAGKRLRVMNGVAEVVNVEVSSNGVITGSKYSYTPASLPGESNLVVLLDQGAFVDTGIQNESAALQAGQWNFTTADVTAPTITYEHQISELEENFPDQTLNLTTSDNKAVVSVVMKHRKIGVKDFTSINAIATTPGIAWSVPFSESVSDDMGFEYYFEARDSAGNVGRHPLASVPPLPNTYHKTILKFTNAKPEIDLPSDGTQTSWRMISVPYILPNRQIDQLFSALPESSKTTWRLLRYNKPPSGSQEWLAPPSFTTLDRGKGYFINSKLRENVTLAEAKAPPETRDNLFSIDLVQGWNQIGNPYTIALNWDEVVAYNGVTGVGKLHLFSTGVYLDGISELGKGAGGFVLCQAAVPGYKFSFPGQLAGQGRIKEETFGDLDSERWKATFRLSQGDIVSEIGGVGMHPEASVNYDEMDGFNPPRFFDYLEVNFDHPEHFLGRFARDIVPKRDDYEWEFSVETNLAGLSTLSWDNSSFGENTKELYLFDLGRQEPVNMREINNYSFDPRESGRFKVYFGDNARARIKPTKVTLGMAYPNPLSSATTIPFTLPEKSTTFAVRLEIFDLLGQKVSTVVENELGPGFYKGEWSVQEGQLTDGVYIYRLSVSGGEGGEGSKVLSGKVLLKK